MSKVPGTFTRANRQPHGTMWTTYYRCDRCGEGELHVEISPEHDEPDGLPLSMRLCDCGGTYWSVEMKGESV